MRVQGKARSFPAGHGPPGRPPWAWPRELKVAPPFPRQKNSAAVARGRLVWWRAIENEVPPPSAPQKLRWPPERVHQSVSQRIRSRRVCFHLVGGGHRTAG